MERNTNSKIYIENVEKGYFVDQPILPNSIPLIKGFVGREEYLKELREYYQNDSRCFVLHGTGGVGKSALALQFAEEIAGEYAAKILVDMQGMSATPLSARDAMFDIVVRQFEHEAAPDISFAQLESLFVKLVQKQPTLIVLDNAASKESVESLKQAKACFITTSRHSFVLTGGKSKQIIQMLPEDARKLLFEIAVEERFDGRADELAYLAGYLPMALKPLASILAENELETAADLIDKYRNKQELLKERVPDYDNLTIEASFELSYEALSDEMKERWRRLSVFPADFDEAAIAAILDVPQVEAKDTQKQLRRFSLLEVNETKRFNLHDLVRVFADAKLSDDERLTAQRPHANHFVSIIFRADEMQINGESNYYANALKLLDTDWDNITAGQKWAAECIEKDNTAAKLCLDYCSLARDFINLRLHPNEDISWLESGLTAARKLNNIAGEGKCLGNLGIAYDNLAQYRKAIAYYNRALAIARNLNDSFNESDWLCNLGIICFNLGEYRRAIEYYEQSLKILCKNSKELLQKINNRSREVNNLCNIGNALSGLGEYQEAIGYYERSLAISQEIGNRYVESSSLSGLGTSYFGLKNFEIAMNFHEQSLAICRDIRNRSGEGSSLLSIGNIYNRWNKYQKAIDCYEQALPIAQEIGSRSIESTILGNIGTAYGDLREYRKAIDFHQQALLIAREISNRVGEGESLGNLGLAYNGLGEREKACDAWKEALNIFETIESPHADNARQLLEKYCRR